MCDEDTFIPTAKNTAFFIEFRLAIFLLKNIELDEKPEIFHLTCELMPRHPDDGFLKEVITLRRALTEVIRLIGCNQLEEVT